MTVVDLLTGLNLVMVLTALIVTLQIIFSLKGYSYVLAKGWKYLLPAILFLSALKLYDFFSEFGTVSSVRYVHELMFAIVSFLLLLALLVQHRAIQEAKTK